jgi:hypothetical protein
MNSYNTFEDITAALSIIWDNANKQITTLMSEKQALENELSLVKNENIEMVAQVQEYKTQHDLMMRNLNRLQTEVDDFEDERKRFSRVSHVVAMEKENHRLKQDIDLQERRIQIYQNQLKQYLQPQHAVWNNSIVLPVFEEVHVLQDTIVQNEPEPSQTQDVIVNDVNLQNEHEPSQAQDVIVDNVNLQNEPVQDVIVNDVPLQDEAVVENTHQSFEDETDDDENDDEEGINVVEKKIKGVIYYLADNGDIYQRNDDESIGDLLGRLETSVSGKTKVKWNN